MGCLQAILCTLLLSLTADCHVHYIAPSQNEPCPVDVCLTLAQFTANTSRYVYLNTTLIFQSGNHISDAPLRISGIRSLQLQKSGPKTATIQCELSGSFSFVNISTVDIKQLRLLNCGDNYVVLVQNLLIVDTYFVGKENCSSALELLRTVAVIRRTYFTSYTKGKIKYLVK